MIDMYIVIATYTLIVALVSFYGGFKVARIIQKHKDEMEKLELKRNINSVYGRMVYMDTDSIRINGVKK